MFKKVISHKFILGLVIFIFIGLIILVLTYNKLTGPSSVTAKQTLTTKLSEQQYDINLTPVLVTDKYVSFDYPKGMILRSTALNSQNSVDDYVFFAKDIYSWTLAIDIATAPDGSVTQTSSFIYRTENPQEYIESENTINGNKTYIFSDSEFSNGFSKVAFFPHGNFVATVALTGDDSRGVGPLEQAFSLVVDSWYWL
jgi:hypothetical protein